MSLLATNVQSAEPWEEDAAYRTRMAADRCLECAEVYLGKAFGRRRPWSRFSFSPECRRWLKQRVGDGVLRPDIVHIHGLFGHVTLAAASAARRAGIPYVLRPAGGLDSRCYRMGRRRLKSLLTSLCLARDLGKAAWVHATSEAEAAELTAWVPRQRIRIVPHGVHVPQLPSGSADAIVQRFPALAGRRVVLFMSRVAAIKRPELVVEAVGRLRSSYPRLLLLIAGHDADAMGTVRNLVAQRHLEDCVLLADFLAGEIKSSALACADVFVLPSLHENFGVAVVEAMAHAVPVVVTPGVAAHQHVDASGGGLTVDGTTEAVADGIRRVLEGDGKAMGRRGREYVAANLAWSAVVKQLDSMYHDAIVRLESRRSPLTHG